MDKNKLIPKLIPGVSEITFNDSVYILTEDSSISVSEKSLLNKGILLRSYLSPSTGFSLPVTIGGNGDISIVLSNDPVIKPDFPDESYKIEAKDGKCSLISGTHQGIARAIQTLRQLFPPEILSDKNNLSVKWEIPGCNISDSPRFPWRGMHLDVCRHFVSKEDIFRFIDLISLYKYNRFHFHLTEDQGWRIEIKKYPELTRVGSVRESTIIEHLNNKPKKYDDKPYGGFYTQEDIKEIVEFAAVREITIVPEIDMPGHMQAAIAAYPQLGCTDISLRPLCHWGISQHILNVEEETLRFVKDVIDEVMDLFPGDYIHIGGDEALKYEWEEQRRIQDRMIELGVKSENELQSWFITQIASHIQKKGKKVIGWDEILEGGIAEGAAVMNWRDEEFGVEAASLGHNVVMTPMSHVYFDFYQKDKEHEPLAIGGLTTLEKVYSFEPIPKELPVDREKFILGSQGQLWTEYMKNFKQIEYMAFPRVCALSEVLWMDKNSRDYELFLNKMEEHKCKLNALDVNYCK